MNELAGLRDSADAARTLDRLSSPDLEPLFRRPSRLGGEGSWYGHIPFVHWIVRATRPRLLVDCDTGSGVAYAAFCDAVLYEQIETRCLAIDTWPTDSAEFLDLQRFHNARYAHFSRLLRGTLDEALPVITDRSIDLLHIDGHQSEQTLRSGLAKWMPKLTSRAVVLLHGIALRAADGGAMPVWTELRDRYPSFEFLHADGLGVLALGDETPPAVARLCGLDDCQAVMLLRDRFALLGERWKDDATALVRPSPPTVSIKPAPKAPVYPVHDQAFRADNRRHMAEQLKQFATTGFPATQREKLRPRVTGLPIEDVITAIELSGRIDTDKAVIELYQLWVAANDGSSPQIVAGWFNLAVGLSKAGETEQAIDAYRKALAARPGFCPAAVNLGSLLEAAGRKDEALEVWKQTLDKSAQPSEMQADLLNNRGRLLELMGRLDEAEQEYMASLRTEPHQPAVIYQLVHVRQSTCTWPLLEIGIPGLSEQVLIDNAGPLTVLAITDRIDIQRKVGAAWIAKNAPAVAGRLSPPEGYRHERIRVGYLSSDFCRHAMSYLIPELFEQHDHSRFELFGYCTTKDDGSEIRQRIIAAFDHFRLIKTMSDEQAARTIREDEIDILIDLNGLTNGERTRVLRYKPAPVQATYLGYIGPVDLPELDYLFCDEFTIPPEIAAEYRPTPLYIGRTYQANDGKRLIAPKPSRAECSLPDDRFVFCCFSKHYKLTETMFGAWTNILARTGDLVLWLAGDNRWSQANIQARAKAAGINPGRIIFAERTSPELYIARLSAADLFLDTSPYNAGTVASDAIRMQLPLLTLAGQSFASRMAGSLLNGIGAHRGITHSLEEYIETAVLLATDKMAYASYKAAFGDDIWAKTIGDSAGFTAAFERTLRRIALNSVPEMADQH